jgi:hypothetical protein
MFRRPKAPAVAVILALGELVRAHSNDGGEYTHQVEVRPTEGEPFQTTLTAFWPSSEDTQPLVGERIPVLCDVKHQTAQYLGTLSDRCSAVRDHRRDVDPDHVAERSRYHDRLIAELGELRRHVERDPRPCEATVISRRLHALSLAGGRAIFRARLRVQPDGADAYDADTILCRGLLSLDEPKPNDKVHVLVAGDERAIVIEGAASHPLRPRWTVPTHCSNCGAAVDQSTAAVSDHPVCGYCATPLPCEPYQERPRLAATVRMDVQGTALPPELAARIAQSASGGTAPADLGEILRAAGFPEGVEVKQVDRDTIARLLEAHGHTTPTPASRANPAVPPAEPGS